MTWPLREGRLVGPDGPHMTLRSLAARALLEVTDCMSDVAHCGRDPPLFPPLTPKRVRCEGAKGGEL